MKTRALYAKVFGGLLALTVVTVGLSFVGMGMAAAVGLALAVASAKAGLIGWYFMDLREATGWIHAIVLIGVTAVAILAVGLLPDVGGRW